MRIGIFTDAYKPLISGVVTSIYTLEHELIKLGHEVFIFTNDTDEEVIDASNVVRFKGLKLPFKGLKSYKLAYLVRTKLKTVKKYKLDIIHIETEFSMAKMAVLASKKYKIPCVYTLHTLYEDYLQYISKTIDTYFHKPFLASLAKILIKPINKQAVIKIVPTRKVLAKINNYYINGDVRVVPTGIDFETLLKNKQPAEELAKLKQKLNINNKLIFVYIGRLSEEKSINLLLDAYAKVKNENTVFIIVGDGPSKEGLLKKCEELNLTDEDVKFLGFVKWEELTPYYEIGDCFLNASVTETQGLTYLESLACGTPILVQKDEALDGLLKEGMNGYFYDGYADLVNKLKLIINDSTIIKNLKNKTYESVKDYSKENYALKMLEIYQEAIKNKDRNNIKFITHN